MDAHHPAWGMMKPNTIQRAYHLPPPPPRWLHNVFMPPFNNHLNVSDPAVFPVCTTCVKISFIGSSMLSVSEPFTGIASSNMYSRYGNGTLLYDEVKISSCCAAEKKRAQSFYLWSW